MVLKLCDAKFLVSSAVAKVVFLLFVDGSVHGLLGALLDDGSPPSSSDARIQQRNLGSPGKHSSLFRRCGPEGANYPKEVVYYLPCFFCFYLLACVEITI